MADPLARIKPVLEIAGGLAVLLAVIGYMSLRASLNHLGVTGVGSFPAGLYLFEAYVIVGAAAAAIALPAAVALALTAAIWSFRRSLGAATGANTAATQRWKVRLFAAALALSPISAMALWWIMQPGAEDTQVLLQPITALAARPRRPEMFILPIFVALILTGVCASQPVACRASGVLGVSLARVARVGCGASALIMLWCAIVNFNIHVRQLEFPVTVVSGNDSSIVACGLLILSTDEIYLLWRPGHGARGHFEHIRRSQLLKIAVGERLRVDDASFKSRLQLHCAPETRALSNRLPSKEA